MRKEILRKVYLFYPAINAWVQRGTLDWPTADEAKRTVAAYVGPAASDRIFDTHHIRGADRAFLRSQEAFDAIAEVIDELYLKTPIPR